MGRDTQAGEPSASNRQIEQEAQPESTITAEDVQDMLAEQRRQFRQLQDEMEAVRAELHDEKEANRRHRSTTVLPIREPPPSSTPQPTSSKVFKMKDPAKFCGGAIQLDRFLTQVKLLFVSHGIHFPRGDPDKVQYAMGLLGTWAEHVDESLRKTQMTDPSEWATERIMAGSECLQDWDLFENEIRKMYGDRNRQLDAASRAIAEYSQGVLDTNETVIAFGNRIQSNWREAGWKGVQEDALGQRMLYDLVWSGLRPGIKARVKPFAGEDGRFESIDELLKKAQDVEIKPSRDKRPQQPATTAEKGGKDKKRHRDSASTPAPTTQPSNSRDNSAPRRSNLPPAPWVDRDTRDQRRERGLCMRCGGSGHKTYQCPKYSWAKVPPQTPSNDRNDRSDRSDRYDRDRQDRDKRPRPAADAQQAKN
jgi:hypothetical protein